MKIIRWVAGRTWARVSPTDRGYLQWIDSLAAEVKRLDAELADAKLCNLALREGLQAAVAAVDPAAMQDAMDRVSEGVRITGDVTDWDASYEEHFGQGGASGSW